MAEATVDPDPEIAAAATRALGALPPGAEAPAARAPIQGYGAAALAAEACRAAGRSGALRLVEVLEARLQRNPGDRPAREALYALWPGAGNPPQGAGLAGFEAAFAGEPPPSASELAENLAAGRLELVAGKPVRASRALLEPAPLGALAAIVAAGGRPAVLLAARLLALAGSRSDWAGFARSAIAGLPPDLGCEVLAALPGSAPQALLTDLRERLEAGRLLEVAAAARGLGRLGMAGDGLVLLGRIERGPDPLLPFLWDALALLLRRLGPGDAPSPERLRRRLLEAAGHPDPEVRRSACRVAAEAFPDPDTETLLEAFGRDPDSRVRATSLRLQFSRRYR